MKILIKGDSIVSRDILTEREKEYENYLSTHIINTISVWKDVLRPAIELDFNHAILEEIDILVEEHDQSKWDDEEWFGYLDNFYPEDEPLMTEEEVETQFKYAWNRHANCNPHHWQYWVLLEDDNPGKPEALDMPIEHVMSMLCDWSSFRYGTADGGLDGDNKGTTRDWYEENKNKMFMTDATIKLIEEYIDILP